MVARAAPRAGCRGADHGRAAGLAVAAGGRRHSLSGNRLDNFGIQAQELDGLPGIIAAPFLHAGWDHLISNSVPFFVLGFLVLLGGAGPLAAVLGDQHHRVGTHRLAADPGDVVILGASGLIFGWLTYLLARGHLVPTARAGGHRRAGTADLRRAHLRRAARQRRNQLAGPPRRRGRRACSPPGCCTGANQPVGWSGPAPRRRAGRSGSAASGVLQLLELDARSRQPDRVVEVAVGEEALELAGELGRPGKPKVPADPTS